AVLVEPVAEKLKLLVVAEGIDGATGHVCTFRWTGQPLQPLGPRSLQYIRIVRILVDHQPASATMTGPIADLNEDHTGSIIAQPLPMMVEPHRGDVDSVDVVVAGIDHAT